MAPIIATRGTGGTWALSVPVPVMTTTEAVVPARRLTLSGTFSTKAPLGQAGPDSPTHEGQHDHADRVKCDGQYDERKTPGPDDGLQRISIPADDSVWRRCVNLSKEDGQVQYLHGRRTWLAP